MKIAKTNVLIVLIIALTNYAVAQQVVGYAFDKYPVSQIYKGPKAKVNLKSSRTALRYRTQIKSQYSISDIEFAGKYSMVFWGAGPGGLTLGAMVDNQTGIIYGSPLTAENSNRGCWSSEVDLGNNILFNKTSKLFITWTCGEEINEATKTNAVTKSYSIFLWNGTKKKFTLLETKIERRTDKITTG